MANTGYKIFTTRKQVMLDPSTGQPGSIETGNTESNVNDDDYVAKELNTSACPLGTAFNMSYIPTNLSSSAACSDQSSTTKYHDGSGTYPANGDYVYDNAALTTAFNGGGKYYKVYEATGYSIIVSSAGYVSNKTQC